MKKILSILIPIIAVYMAYNFFNRNVERSIEIDAPQSKVWQEVKNFKNWDDWSSWAENDPSIKNTYEGVDGAVGSSVSWTSDNSGNGKMTTTAITENEEMKYHLEFFEPWQSQSDGYVRVKENEGKTTVTWGMINDPGFMVALMNMNSMVGKDFERGLELLKEKVDKLPNEEVSNTDLQVQKGTFNASKYLVVKHDKFPIESLTGDFYGENFGKLMSCGVAFSESAIPSAIYFTWDDKNGVTDMAIAMKLDETPPETPEGFEVVSFEDSETVYVDYYGMYKDMGRAHDAIHMHFKQNNISHDAVAIEEYITDPATEKDPSKWLTKISYLLK